MTVRHFAKEIVQAEVFDPARELALTSGGQERAEPAAVAPVDRKLAAERSGEWREVFREGEVKAAPAAVPFVAGQAAEAIEVVAMVAAICLAWR